jgi:hypothetical protein
MRLTAARPISVPQQYNRRAQERSEGEAGIEMSALVDLARPERGARRARPSSAAAFPRHTISGATAEIEPGLLVPRMAFTKVAGKLTLDNFYTNINYITRLRKLRTRALTRLGTGAVDGIDLAGPRISCHRLRGP